MGLRWLLGWALLASLGCETEVDALAEAETAFRAGQYQAAASSFTRALEAAPASDVPAIRARLGQTLKLLNQTPAAEQALRRAISEADALGDGAVAARAQRYLGRLLADGGRLAEAEVAYSAAHAWHQEHGPADALVKLQVNRAGLAWQQGDFESAWTRYQDVYRRAVTLDDERLQANGMDGMAMLLGYVGEFEAATELVLQTALMHQNANRRSDAAVSYATQGLLEAAQGDALEARRLARIALAIGEDTGRQEVVFQAHVVLAMAANLRDEAAALQHAEAASAIANTMGGGPILAESELAALEALARSRRWSAFAARADAFPGKGPEQRARLETLRARHARARGDAAATRAHLEAAVAHFETVRRALGMEALSSLFTAERLEAYEHLIAILAEAGDAEAALRVVGGVKARAFAERLRTGPEPEGVPAAPAGGSRSPLPSSRTVQRATNLFRIGRIAPPVDPGALRARLPADVAVVEYYALPDRLLVFWLQQDRVEIQQVKVARAQLRETAEAHLLGIRAGGDDYLRPGKRLGRWLLDPIAARLAAARGVRLLVMVPHGPLHPVPFEALPWAGRLLVDRFAIVSAANLTAVNRALKHGASPRPKQVVTVGDPMENLPGARVEAQEVAAVFSSLSSKSFVGSAARESSVREAMGGADLLHFAVHGIRPRPDAPAYLELVPDSAFDGRLYADELATQSLANPLVVLSVCDSARGRPNEGDEIVGVVDRAFLEAGARSVMASRWPVHDAASVLFMRNFYAALGGLGSGEVDQITLIGAFHRAQLALRNGRAKPEELGPLLASLDGSRVRGVRPATERRGIRDFTHPYFWATFSLRGAWR